jgi:DNA polymerase-3 subunit delta
MSAIDPSALKTALKSGTERVYYFYGKNVTDIEATVKHLLSRLIKKGNEDFNRFSFFGKDFEADAFSAACDALPVFADCTVITVNDLNAEKLSADALKVVITAIEQLADTNCVIFYNTSVDITDGKKYPTAKNKKITDIAAKVGVVVEFNPKTAQMLSKEIIKKVSSLGGVISPSAAVFLAETCNCDSLICERECEKLCAFCAGREITADDIKAVTPAQPDSGIFDLTKAVAVFNGERALKIFRELIYQRVEPIAILYTLSANMLDLYRAKTAVMSGKSTADMKANFAYPKNRSFTVDNAFRDCRRPSLTHLRDCIKILAQTDAAIKSSRADPVILIEEALVRMIYRDQR